MKNYKIWLFVLYFSNFAFSQVGIGNTAPKATLDIAGKSTDSTVADGVIAPRIKLSDLKKKSAYSTAQVGAIVYVSDTSGNKNAVTSKITSMGYYYFNGTVWCSMNSGDKFSYGDIKTGIQLTDHSGWVKLDGRTLTSLTASQHTQATKLGLSGNLPNASNAYLVQNGSALGSVSGSNTRTLVQSQLPNVTPIITVNGASAGTPSGTVLVNQTTATMQSSGAHSHSIGRRGNNDVNAYDPFDGNRLENSAITSDRTFLGAFQTTTNGAHSHVIDPHDHTASFTGVVMSNHTHSAIATSINPGAQVALDIKPLSLSVNTFIFLGE